MTREEALEILGLDANASLEEARAAYRALARSYHPDKNSASNAAVMFRIISDAWVVVQNTVGEQRATEDIKQQRAAAEAAYRRAEEERKKREAAYRQAQEEERKKRDKEAEQQVERKAAQVVENILTRSWLVWFIISNFPCLIIMIGSWTGISGFSGSAEDFSINKNLIKILLGRKLFTDPEPIDWLYYGLGSLLISFFIAVILGPITGLFIVETRRIIIKVTKSSK